MTPSEYEAFLERLYGLPFGELVRLSVVGNYHAGRTSDLTMRDGVSTLQF